MVPFVVGGYPSLTALGQALVALSVAGAAVIEIGVPFSDPIADGPVISEAMRHAIEGGTTPSRLFDEIARVRSSVSAAIVLMVSTSIVERVGRERFLRSARAAGVDGVIVPDLDLDEAPDLSATCRELGLSLSMLVAPSSSPDRCRRIIESCSGFVYLLARQGVTGTGSEHSSGSRSELSRRVADLRSITKLPIACGFGISTPEQVAEVMKSADAAIVGSAFVRVMSESLDSGAAARAASALLTRLSGAAAPSQ